MNGADEEYFVSTDQINPTQYDTFAYSPSVINVLKPGVQLK